MSAFLSSMETCLQRHKWWNASLSSGPLGISPDPDFCMVTGSTVLCPYFGFSFWVWFPVFRILADCCSLGPTAHPTPRPHGLCLLPRIWQSEPTFWLFPLLVFYRWPFDPRHVLIPSLPLIMDLSEKFLVYCLRDWNNYALKYLKQEICLWMYN